MSKFKLPIVSIITGFVLLISACNTTSSPYEISIEKYRNQYKQDFNREEHSPLKGAQLDDMRFYKADEAYKVIARVEYLDQDSIQIMPTSSGKEKEFAPFAKLHFSLQGKDLVLIAFQNIKIRRIPQFRDLLFVPYKDHTNGEVSYGGGRYIDLRAKDIENEQIELDFNKSYNPYCAYSSGFNCPIPPYENHLDIAIEAGEKMYAGEYISH